MIPKQCKRLVEVDFPIATVSKHAVKEKSAKYGHPSTLHLWWARRLLAACRAIQLAPLLPDPCDPNCPGTRTRLLGVRLGSHQEILEGEAMKVKYDAKTESITVILREGVPIAESDEGKPGVILDYNEHGNLVSLEILDASSRVTDARTMEFTAA